MAKIALLGIPIIHNDSYTVRGLSCIPGATDKPRKDLEQLLIQDDPRIAVVGLGEIIKLPNERVVINKPNFDDFIFEAERIITFSDYDAVLVVGGDHVAALPFYKFPGLVVRADVHGDAYAPNSSSYLVNGGTYMFYVKEKGLKSADEVWNVGVQIFDTRYYNKGIFGQNLTMKEVLEREEVSNISFLDIDMDVLSIYCGLPTLHPLSDLIVEDLVTLVIKLNPKIVGLFECVSMDNRGYSLIPDDIISAFPNVFKPICKAVGEVAIARSLGGPQVYSAVNH